MNKISVTKIAVVRNPKGIHLRPAGLLAELAAKFTSDIKIVKDEVRANGRSILDIVTLVASEGATLTIIAEGDDAHKAVEALVRFIETDTTEEEDEEGEQGS